MRNFLLTIGGLAFALCLNAQEKITNGTFDIDGALPAQAGTEWGMYTENGGTVEVIDGVVVATPGAADEIDPWKLQLEQKNFLLDNDTTYTIKFKAWSTAARTIQLTVEDPPNGYRRLGSTPDEDGEVMDSGNRSKWTVAITTEQVEYTKTVTIDSVVENTAVKLAFLLSATTDVVYIDNVSMMASVVAPNSIETIPVSESIYYPNPAYDMIYVNGRQGITVFDLTGKLVLTSNDSKVNISSLSTGIYFIKSGTRVQKLIKK